ncbi:MAG: endonuclease MutS2 [Dehalococcoidia bacterium]|nr:endonuclease MutS2 [Dehalococcoidia bacterium]
MTHQYDLEKLEYTVILDRLLSFTRSDAGYNLTKSLRPSSTHHEVLRKQQETFEAVSLLSRDIQMLSDTFPDIRPKIYEAQRGGLLTTFELLEVGLTCRVGNQCRTNLGKYSEIVPFTWSKISGAENLSSIASMIHPAVDDSGAIKDNASPELAEIRMRRKSAHDQLLKKMDGMAKSAGLSNALQEPIVVMREGRYVLPVKAGFQSNVPGIVHDSSASGSTVFIQPSSAIGLGNIYKEAQAQEERELEKILKHLSNAVGQKFAELEYLVAQLAEVDLIQAKGLLATDLDALELYQESSPSNWIVTSDRALSLVDARHPLIEGDVIPISLRVTADEQDDSDPMVLLITGPNTGGKTVSLKTCGLLALMSQAGLPVPASVGTQMPVFQNVLADIGDEQSIQHSLSTFSAHVATINSILSVATPGSLILIDEIGAGTDPREGAALGIALIQELLRKQVAVVCTTHHAELKIYAHTNQKITNASTEFNTDTLQPTYRLLMGIPGESNAIAIASRLGLPSSVIDAARLELGVKERDLSSMLTELKNALQAAEENVRETENEKAEMTSFRNKTERELRETLETVQTDTRHELDLLRRESARLMQLLTRAKREVEAVKIRQLESEVQEVTDQVAATVEAGIEQSKRRDLDDYFEEVDPNQLAPGMQVTVQGFDIRGEIQSWPDDDGSLVVIFGNLSSRIQLSAILEVHEPAPQTKGRVPSQRRVDVDSELDIRGNRIDEAVPLLERYLDQATEGNIQTARIIHGKGTGALKTAVREFLVTHPSITDFSSAPAGQGGDGVTVVSFKN